MAQVNPSRQDVLPGLEVRLLPHQVIGVAWMVDQERNTRYKGGILAYALCCYLHDRD